MTQSTEGKSNPRLATSVQMSTALVADLNFSNVDRRAARDWCPWRCRSFVPGVSAVRDRKRKRTCLVVEVKVIVLEVRWDLMKE